MQKLKDGRVKIKYDELCVGMVLFYEVTNVKGYENQNEFILVTSIYKSGNRKWFDGLTSKNPHRFIIPESYLTKKVMARDHYSGPSLRNMYLVNPEKLKGINWNDKNISYGNNIGDFLNLSVY